MTNPQLMWRTGGGESLVSEANGFTLIVARSGTSGCIRFVVMTTPHGEAQARLVCAGIRRNTREAMAAAERIGLAFERRRVARQQAPRKTGSIAWLTTLPQYRAERPRDSGAPFPPGPLFLPKPLAQPGLKPSPPGDHRPSAVRIIIRDDGASP